MWTLTLLFATVLLFVAYFSLSISYTYWRKKKVPHPPVSGPFGHLIESLTFKKSLGQIYHDIYRKYPSSPYVGFYKVRKPGIIIRDAELVKEILVRSFPSFHANDVVADEEADPLIARHPFFTQGEQWKTSRSQLTAAFTSRQMKSLFPLMEGVCATLNKHLEETNHGVNGIEAKDLCQKFTMDVVASCVLGLEANSFVNPNVEFKRMVEKIISPSPLVSFKLLILFAVPALARFLRIQIVPNDAADYFRRIISETIKYRKENSVVRGDYLDIMQELRDKLGEDVFTEEDITARVLGFFLDGFETSSIAMSFILYELGANPALQNKLRMEIDKASEKNGGKFSYEAIQAMTYLDQIVNESLRMHPPGPFLAKLCTKDFPLPSPTSKGAEVNIEQGTPIVIPVYSLHYDPKYHPNPNKFDPERFSDEQRGNLVKCAYLPFGEGPRMCPGQRFAMLQVKTAIVHVVSKYEIRVNNHTITPLEMDPTYMLLAAKGGLWLDFHKRQN